MTVQQWDRVCELFTRARELSTADADPFLVRECAGDEALLNEVRELLDADRHTAFVDYTPAGLSTATVPAPSTEQNPVFSAGETVAARYRIVRYLNRGGMGEVYEAEDLELKERVALKTLLPAIASNQRMIARFKQEIQLARKIAHPNVCRVFDLARHPLDGSAAAPTFFLTMEFLAGETLAARLDREGPLAPAAAEPLLRQMAGALEAAHQAGVVHRDFKPSNVMLAPAGDGVRAVVTDFGLARAFVTASQSTATMSRPLMGTLDYMAPELLGGSMASPRSDVYALGMVGYKMVTGSLPFAGETPLGCAIRRSRQAVPSPRTLVPALDANWERAILRALDPNPANRYSQPRHFVQALSGETPSVTVAVPAVTRRRLILAGIAVLAVAGEFWGWRALVDYRKRPSAEALQWYENGVAALRDGTYFHAANALQKAIAAEPGFAIAHARLADALSELDDSEHAGQEMIKATQAQTGRGAPTGDDPLYIAAIQSALVGDYPAAIQRYRKLADKHSGEERAFALEDLGRALERNSEPAKALEAWAEAARLAPRNAGVHLRAGTIYGNRLRKLDAAAAEFDKADSIYQALANVEGQVEVLFQRGLLASTTPKLAEARALLERAQRMAHEISTLHQEIAATLQLSVVAYQEGKRADAEQIAASAVTAARNAGMPNLAARGLTDLGVAQGSIATLKDAVVLAQHYGLKRNEARAQLILGSLYSQQGLNDEALSAAQAALAFFQKAGFRQLTAQCLTLIARVTRERGGGAEALAQFEKLQSLAEEVNDQTQLEIAEQGIASIHLNQDRLPEALAHYDRYYKIAKSIPDPLAIGLSLVGRATTLLRLGKADDAEELLREADQFVGQPRYPVNLDTLILSRRAALALTRCDYRAAAALGQQAIAAKSSTPPTRAHDSCVAGLALAMSGAAAEGERLCRDGVDALVKMTNVYDAAESRLALAQVLFAAGDARQAAGELSTALESFQDSSRKEFEWRALVLMAQIRNKLGDQAGARQAAELAVACLAELRTQWGDQVIGTYRQRRDVQRLEAALKSFSQ